MTEEQKDTLLAKMLQSPESLSDSEILQILEDDELREIHDLAVDVRHAKRTPSVDPEAEWLQFSGKIARPRRRLLPLVVVAAASVAAVAVLAVAVFAFLKRTADPGEPLIALTESEQVEIEIAEPPAEAPDAPRLPAQPAVNQPRALTAATASETAPDDDIDEMLRIEQARIDNEIARQYAEVLLAEYYAKAEIDPDAACSYDDGYTYYDGLPIDNELVNMIIQ